MKFPIALKLTLLIAFLLFIVVVITTFRFSRLTYLEIEEKFGRSLLHIATTASLQINEREHRTIRRKGDHKKRSFSEIRDYLRRVQQANNLEEEAIYTFQVNEKGELHFAVMLYKEPFVGNPYDYMPDENKPIYRRVVEKGVPAYTGIYRSESGTWISGLAPIKDGDGKVTGILEVDYKLEQILGELRQILTSIVLGGITVILISLIIGLLLAHRFVRPIRLLRDKSSQIAKEDFSDILLDIRSKDEIGELAREFEEMAKSLRERLYLLTYISKDTLEMAKKVLLHEVEEEGEKKELSILFSDIRGFTNYSEHRKPKEVIAMLNQYLGVQSDLIKTFHGRIDKYVGDEIIAVFEGDLSASHAVDCALAMQEAISDLNANLAKETHSQVPIQVGIGIAKGEVFMGSVGGNDLKDFTAIGSYVNLAARLCSKAEPKTILVTEDVKSAAEQNQSQHAVFEPQGKAHYKGFSSEIRTFLVLPRKPQSPS